MCAVFYNISINYRLVVLEGEGALWMDHPCHCSLPTQGSGNQHPERVRNKWLVLDDVGHWEQKVKENEGVSHSAIADYLWPHGL